MCTAIPDLQAAVEEEIGMIGNGVSVAVLPDGPLTIPFIDQTHAH